MLPLEAEVQVGDVFFMFLSSMRQHTRERRQKAFSFQSHKLHIAPAHTNVVVVVRKSRRDKTNSPGSVKDLCWQRPRRSLRQLMSGERAKASSLEPNRFASFCPLDQLLGNGKFRWSRRRTAPALSIEGVCCGWRNIPVKLAKGVTGLGVSTRNKRVLTRARTEVLSLSVGDDIALITAGT